MLFLTRVGERYTAQSIVSGTTKKGGGKTIKDSKQQAPEVLASSIMGTEQDVRSSTQKDALQSGVSSGVHGLSIPTRSGDAAELLQGPTGEADQW